VPALAFDASGCAAKPHVAGGWRDDQAARTGDGMGPAFSERPVIGHDDMAAMDVGFNQMLPVMEEVVSAAPAAGAIWVVRNKVELMWPAGPTNW